MSHLFMLLDMYVDRLFMSLVTYIELIVTHLNKLNITEAVF